MGNFQISDIVFKQIIECVSTKVKGIYKIPRIIVKKHEGYNDGIFIYIETVIEFGFNVNETMSRLKSLIIREIENLTAMNVLNMEITVKGVHYEPK